MFWTQKYKAIAFDLDDTLIDLKEQLTPGMSRQLRQLKQEGFELFIVTGRNVFSFRQLLDRESMRQVISLFHPLVLCNDGNTLYDTLNGKVEVLHTLDREPFAAWQSVYPVVRHLVMECGDQVYGSTRTAVIKYAQLLHISVKHVKVGDCQAVEDLSCLHELFIFPEQELTKGTTTCFAGGKIQKYSAFHCLKITPEAADKSAGLRHVIKSRGLSMDEVIAIGNGENDIPMLMEAGLGIAVRHSKSTVILAAGIHLQVELDSFLDISNADFAKILSP